MKRTLLGLSLVCLSSNAMAQALPPVAQRAVILLLKTPRSDANAILYVEFAPGRPAPAVLKLRTDQGTVTLRDDGQAPDDQKGDGIHSGFLKVSVDVLTAAQRRLASIQTPIPLFAGREVVAYGKPRVVAPDQIPSGSAAEALRSLPVIPSRENPEGHRARRTKEIPVIDLPVVTTIKAGFFVPMFHTTDPKTIDAARTLAITDPRVVGDTARTYVPCTMGGGGAAAIPTASGLFTI